MLLVKTKVLPSPIEGLGLFADEPIPKGTVVWKFVPHFDAALTKEELDALPPPAREHMAVYGYLSTTTGRYILCSDGGKYCNHATDPNLESQYGADEEVVSVASRDIAVGEEITCDYGSFEKNWNGVP